MQAAGPGSSMSIPRKAMTSMNTQIPLAMAMFLTSIGCGEPIIIIEVSNVPTEATQLIVSPALDGAEGKKQILAAAAQRFWIKFPSSSTGPIHLDISAVDKRNCVLSVATIVEERPSGLRPYSEVQANLSVVSPPKCPDAGNPGSKPPCAQFDISSPHVLMPPTGDSTVAGFGQVLALNGGVLAIAAPASDAGRGAVFLFDNASDGTLSTTASKVLASDGTAGHYFGSSIAIDSQGNNAFIGAPYNKSGSVYWFQRGATGWDEGYAFSSNAAPANALFGSAVSISNELAVIGAPGEDKVYTIVRSSSSVTLDPARTLVGVTGEEFGASLAMVGDLLLVGAPNASPMRRGAVYAYKKLGDTWTKLNTLTWDGTTNYTKFGSSLSFSSELTAIIGAPEVSNNTGGVAVASYSSGSWTITEPKLNGPVLSGGFGFAIGAYGTFAVVGAPNANATEGASYLLDIPSLTPTVLPVPTKTPGTYFGTAVSVSDRLLATSSGRGVSLFNCAR